MEKLKAEISRFIIVGVSAVIADAMAYYFLSGLISHSPAKAVSFLCGTIIAYIFNKYWTFAVGLQPKKDIIKFLALYSFTMLVNVGVNMAVLSIGKNLVLPAFLAATASSTVLNFIGQKFFVFKKHE